MNGCRHCVLLIVGDERQGSEYIEAWMDEPSQKQCQNVLNRMHCRLQNILYNILQRLHQCADGRTFPKIAAAANKPTFHYNRYCTHHHDTCCLYFFPTQYTEIEQSPLYVWSSEGLLKCVSLHQLMLQSIEQLSTMIEAAGMIISNANSHSWKQDGKPLQKIAFPL